MAVNIFSTVGEFVKTNIAGHYYVFGILIVAIILICFLAMKIPPKFALLLLSPAVFGVAVYFLPKWILYSTILLILIITAMVLIKIYGE